MEDATQRGMGELLHALGVGSRDGCAMLAESPPRAWAERTADELEQQGIKPEKLFLLCEVARRYISQPWEAGTPYRGSHDVYTACAHMSELQVEQFLAVALDNKHRALREIMVSRGSLTTAIVHPRDVFRPLILHGAAAVIFVHNHPSGDPTPSREDLELTARLRQTGELVGIRVLDHIVIGRGRFVSFVDDGYWS